LIGSGSNCGGKTRQIPPGLLENPRFLPLYLDGHCEWHAGEQCQLNSCDSGPLLISIRLDLNLNGADRGLLSFGLKQEPRHFQDERAP
jgi:hypothetical protein